MEWKESFVTALEARDARESSLNEFFVPFLQAAAMATVAVTMEDEQGSVPKTIEEFKDERERHLQQIADFKTRDGRIELLEKDIRLVKLKMQSKFEEEAMRQRAVQLLQDEILALQIQLNVIEEQSSKLKEENQGLVGRLMARIESEADNINRMNEIVEASKKRTVTALPADYPQIHSDDDGSE